ncbi:hypothetical protein UAY_02438 [Enterococcus moraviensis ATCC BAA-383]|uniref:Uncharacterized protein n=1 Tax=Enterococcus moraviensis ATCC BAA-383 TaxID=1158609 RepID=R2QL07_9ENTE|nr:hypothetical protein [Enterococcus moraviensis]EOH97282.1 hypothetical protein UAY_02438 [Enterococcus moraviensis ATCC BAA-383]EOT71658.1 hypothetical protein I586_01465 [Enterococcus moraviensis ATCC BAA-383]
MKENELRKKRIENEEKQEKTVQISLLLERKMEEYRQLAAKERIQNERILAYFHGQDEFSFFEDIIEETRIEERRFFDEMNEGQEIVNKEKRQLEEYSETLYEAELQALREEDDADG